MEAARPRSFETADFAADAPEFPRSPTLAAFAASLNGAVVLPASEAYDEARGVHNLRFDARPVVIVQAADASDVARTIAFATETGLELAVRSGGHSLAGHSTVDGGILLDLAPMKGLLIDPDRRLAWAQPGLTAGEITAAAAAHGVAVPFGDTGSVGIGGLTTGGGIGFLTRKHGLTIDNLIAAEVVTADGRILTVDEDRHPDLFWAIRGGGGNVGVVTRFVYRLVEVDTVVGGGLILPASPETLAGLVAAAQAAPEELSLIAFVMYAPPLPFVPAERVGELALFIVGVATGELESGTAAWAPIRALAEPIADLVGPMPYPAIYALTEGGAAPGGASIRSWFADGLDIEDAGTMIDLMRRAPSPGVIVQVRVLGGAMARVAPGATAFAHRDAGVMIAAMATFEPGLATEAHDAWTTAFFAAFEGKATGVYANFLSGEGEARVRSAYPAGTYEKLAAIKGRYDPRNLFRRNQNVAPARLPGDRDA
jgi:FAD/FMN-containing dehydrogenase